MKTVQWKFHFYSWPPFLVPFLSMGLVIFNGIWATQGVYEKKWYVNIFMYNVKFFFVSSVLLSYVILTKSQRNKGKENNFNVLKYTVWIEMTRKINTSQSHKIRQHNRSQGNFCSIVGFVYSSISDFFLSHTSKWYFPFLPFPFSFDFCFPCWSYGSQPCLTQRNYEPCCVGPPKMDESWWRVLTKCGPLEKRMANHFSILTLRTPWMVWKGKKIYYWKMNSPGR